jgi:transposase
MGQSPSARCPETGTPGAGSGPGNGPADEAGTAPRADFTTHVSRAMRELIAARDWLTVFQLPPYASELNPVEMSLPQCELRRSSLAWLSGSLSWEVSIGMPVSVQRRRLW